jgi:hypothetical protein
VGSPWLDDSSSSGMQRTLRRIENEFPSYEPNGLTLELAMTLESRMDSHGASDNPPQTSELAPPELRTLPTIDPPRRTFPLPKSLGATGAPETILRTLPPGLIDRFAERDRSELRLEIGRDEAWTYPYLPFHPGRVCDRHRTPASECHTGCNSTCSEGGRNRHFADRMAYC